MRTAKFDYAGRTYLATRVHIDGHWSFTAHGETFMHKADMDLFNEFGVCDAEWGQYIDDVMLDLDLIYFCDETEEYVNYKDGPKIQVVGLGHPDYYVQH